MLDAKLQNACHEMELDKEWLVLLTIAKRQGLSVQQVREFLKEKRRSKLDAKSVRD
ncbi:anti-repressor SinI family protein [Gracilibacillus xinjiangensis]|uniref:Anti-repressor SinI family protein n=1 Tax=Gracilibacillus xinjiangensis TaxID=1193282 RepID=A0ABV8WTM4_9BACI